MTKEWLEMYFLAKNFYNDFNDLLIPQRYEKNGKKLGRWISDQRTKYNKGKLEAEKIKLLEEIDMVWDATKYRGTSLPEQILYFYIKKYFPNAINKYLDLGYELDIFIPEINLAFEYDGGHHKNKKNKDIEKNKKCEKNNIFLIRIREKECESLQFKSNNYIEFKLNNKFNKTIGFNELNETLIEIFKFINNKYNLNIKYIININKDIDNIMDFYKKSINLNWEKKFQDLKKWYEENNNLIIPPSFLTDGTSLEKWLKRQRINYKKGLLTKHQIKSLESLNISWDPYEDLWYENYFLLQQYYNEYGDINKLKTKEKYKGKNIGEWLFKQRQAYKGSKDRRKITEERISLLEKLDIIWDPLETIWNNHYNEIIQEYQKGNIVFKPNFKTENGFCPLNWINKQKNAFKNGKLPENKVQKLKEIGIL